MQIPAAEPHVDAFMDLVRARTPASLKVGLAVAPAGEKALPYAVVYPDGGGVSDGRLSGDRSYLFMVFLVHAVGSGPEQCLWVVDRVRQAVLGQELIVPGRKCHRLTQDTFPSQMMRDWNAQPPIYQQLFEFELRSEPK